MQYIYMDDNAALLGFCLSDGVQGGELVLCQPPRPKTAGNMHIIAHFVRSKHGTTWWDCS